MKRIKPVLLLIFSLFCLLSLFGCSSDNYVKDSFYFRSTYLSTVNKVANTVAFNVYLPDAASYDISYTLELYYGAKMIDYEDFSDTHISSGDEIYNISKSWRVSYSESDIDDSKFEVRLVNLKVKSDKTMSDTFYGLSIGFGATGGVILIGILVLYICLNKRNKKEPTA